MKKKIIAVCLMLTLLASLLVSCGSGSGTSSKEIPEDKPEEMTLDFSFGKRTGEYYGEVNEDGLPDGTGTFSSENDKGIKYTYTGDWVDGHWEGNAKSTWEDGTVYEGGYSNDVFDGYGEHTFSNGNIYKGNFSDGDADGDGAYYFTDGTRFEGTFTDLYNATGTFFDEDGVSYDAHIEDNQLKIEPAYDFFTDEEHQERYETLYESYQFSELYDYVNDYIAEAGDDISSGDSAYSIIDLIKPLLEYQDTWTVEQDDADSSYFVEFNGADEISSSESVKLILSGTSVMQTIGFRKSDWLFFDEYIISIDGEKVKSNTIKSTKRDDDVVSGGTIEESYSSTQIFPDDVCEQFKDAGTAMIRFTNSDTEESYDCTLTEAEMTAIYVSSLLRDNWVELSNLLTRYRLATDEDAE